MNLRLWVVVGIVSLACSMPGGAAAQTSPQYPLPAQDEFDPQGRNSTVLGSGARALGMGGAFLARADDATAASWNPAGLSYLRRPELSLVGARSAFDKFDFATNQDDKSDGSSPDFVSIAYPVTIGKASGAVQVSFQRAISLDYDRSIVRPGTPADDEAGIPAVPGVERQLKSTGGFDTISIGTGIRLSQHLRLGVTYNRWFNRFSLQSERDLSVGGDPASRSSQLTKLNLRGWNLNFGAIYSPVETINVGAVIKTSFDSSGSLFRRRSDSYLGPNSPTVLQAKIRPLHEAPPLPVNNLFEPVALHWPFAMGLGLSWRPFSTVTMAVDFTRTYWSGAELRNYFLLRRGARPDDTEGNDPNRLDYGLIVNPETGRAGLPLPYPNLDLVGTTLQRDSQQLRLGIEYVLLTGRLRWPIRMGYFTDRQNFPASVVRREDADRSLVSFTKPPTFHGATFGVGIVAGNTLIDVAHIYEWGRHTGNDGSVKTRSHRTLVSVIYRFGTPR